MASYEKLKDGTWSVRFRIFEDGKEKNKRLTHWEGDKTQPKFYTKKEATQGYLDYQEKARKIPAKPVYSPASMTFGELVQRYLENLKYNAKESSYYTNERKITTLILSYFDDKTPVTLIKTSQILNWQNNLTEKGYAFSYKKSARALLSSIFKTGELYDIYYNPVKKVPNFKNIGQKPEMRFFTEKEFLNYLSVIHNIRDKALFSFLYIMGTRKGETLSLQWKDIDLKNKTLKIYKTVTKDTNGAKTYKITAPKTNNSYRQLDIPDNLLDLLIKLKKSIDGCSEEFYVFGREENLPFQTLSNIHKRYTISSSSQKIRIHDFRHSSVSYMINHGENQISAIFTIAKRLGDTTEEIYKTYGHLFPDEGKKLIDKFNDLTLT